MPIAFGGGIFGGGGGGVSGIGAAGRLALWSSASGLTSDSGLTYSGTGATFTLAVPSVLSQENSIPTTWVTWGTTTNGLALVKRWGGFDYGFVGNYYAGLYLGTNGTVRWTSTSFGDGTPDTSLSRISAGVVGVGTGAEGSVAGTVSAAQLTLGADAIQTRRAAATLQLGAADSATPVAQTLAFQGSRGGTDTNTAGADATIQGSLGTGTGASGKIVFKIGTPNASGSTQHTANTVLTLQDTGTGGTAAPKGIFAGPVIAQVQVTANTGTATPAATDSRTVYTNTGDTDGSTVTLPAAAAGLQYTIYVDAAQTVTITAVGDDTIRIAGNVTAAAGSITSNVTGSSVTLTAISATQWVATSSLGTWTF